ncbi:HTH_Tnp_Tc3_2 domain-containing protein [Trichonephila clavipes]|nr:HTH_Tnp_Tc3_2 domain-containing protein [Trichonephila clavipes]
MSRFGGLSEERPSVFKTRSKLGTHLSTQCSGMKGRVDLAQPVNRTPDLLVDAPCCCQVDRSECAVIKCWEKWTRGSTHARNTGSGATRKITRRENRRIVQQALVDPTVARSTIRADVYVAIVPQTISRHLAEANLKSKRPFRALPLTPEHRQLRLQWCQARSMWNVTDWKKVVFSDESRFVLGTDDNRVRVWRRPGERYNSPTLFYVILPAQLV